MLILTRTPGESILLSGSLGPDERIEVVALGLNEWGEMRIGIEAPPEVHILRSEIKEKKHGD